MAQLLPAENQKRTFEIYFPKAKIQVAHKSSSPANHLRERQIPLTLFWIYDPPSVGCNGISVANKATYKVGKRLQEVCLEPPSKLAQPLESGSVINSATHQDKHSPIWVSIILRIRVVVKNCAINNLLILRR